jgi:endo-1,4-beta-D-glucanase Y
MDHNQPANDVDSGMLMDEVLASIPKPEQLGHDTQYELQLRLENNFQEAMLALVVETVSQRLKFRSLESNASRSLSFDLKPFDLNPKNLERLKDAFSSAGYRVSLDIERRPNGDRSLVLCW